MATGINRRQDEQSNELSYTTEGRISATSEGAPSRNGYRTTERRHRSTPHAADMTSTLEEGTSSNSKKTGLYPRLPHHKGDIEKKKTSIKMIEEIFNRVESLFRSREFEPHAVEIIKYSPRFMTELQKRREDLKKEELCIIIAGETSGGKSTLVNRLVGRQIFKPNIVESTATICRIRNSNDPTKISCKVIGRNSRIIDDRNFESAHDGRIMKFIAENVDKNKQLANMNIDHVDVSLYFPFLKGNSLIVDTPGIGGSLELADKMMNYLPNAVAFIFVTNVTSAGGVQEDRLLKIIQEIVRLHDEKDITCLDPRNALFISNKWDAVPKTERDDAWKTVQTELKKHWPHLTTENIFRTSLMSTRGGEPDLDAEFERFQKRLAQVVASSQCSRQSIHVTFLKKTLKALELHVKSHIHAMSKSKEEQIKYIEKLEVTVSQLQKDMEKRRVQLKNLISDSMLDLSQTLLEELKSESGKQRILNPPGKREITFVHVLKVQQKVKERILTYINKWARGKTVIIKLGMVHKAIEENFSNIHGKIRNIESELKGLKKVSMHEKQYTLEPDTPILVGIVASAPIWIPILAAAGTLCVVAGFILSPVVARQVSQWNNPEKKMNAIDKTYNEFVDQYTIADIKPELERTYGEHYNQLVDRLFAETSEKRISYLKGTIIGLKGEYALRQRSKAQLEMICKEIDDIKISLYSLSRN